jgi:hypothetical protein
MEKREQLTSGCNPCKPIAISVDHKFGVLAAGQFFTAKWPLLGRAVSHSRPD